MGKIAEATKNKTGKQESRTLKQSINLYQGEIAKALPKAITPERFARMAVTALTTTPKLKDCTEQSFIGAMLQAAQLGLEPNTPLGQAYLIPYENRKAGITECQFQIGYKGIMNLAQRSGEIKNIEAHVVHENDEFEFEYGLNSTLRHVPAMGERGKAVWVYAIYRLINGGYGFEVMSYDECLKHGERYSKAYYSGPWQTQPEEMAKKTMIKKVLKYAPMMSDFITSDGATFDFNTDTGEVIPNLFDDEPAENADDVIDVPADAVDAADVPDIVDIADSEINKN